MTTRSTLQTMSALKAKRAAGAKRVAERRRRIERIMLMTSGKKNNLVEVSSVAERGGATPKQGQAVEACERTILCPASGAYRPYRNAGHESEAL